MSHTLVQCITRKNPERSVVPVSSTNCLNDILETAVGADIDQKLMLSKVAIARSNAPTQTAITATTAKTTSAITDSFLNGIAIHTPMATTVATAAPILFISATFKNCKNIARPPSRSAKVNTRAEKYKGAYVRVGEIGKCISNVVLDEFWNSTVAERQVEKNRQCREKENIPRFNWTKLAAQAWPAQ